MQIADFTATELLIINFELSHLLIARFFSNVIREQIELLECALLHKLVYKRVHTQVETELLS